MNEKLDRNSPEVRKAIDYVMTVMRKYWIQCIDHPQPLALPNPSKQPDVRLAVAMAIVREARGQDYLDWLCEPYPEIDPYSDTDDMYPSNYDDNEAVLVGAYRELQARKRRLLELMRAQSQLDEE